MKHKPGTLIPAIYDQHTWKPEAVSSLFVHSIGRCPLPKRNKTARRQHPAGYWTGFTSKRQNGTNSPQHGQRSAQPEPNPHSTPAGGCPRRSRRALLCTPTPPRPKAFANNFRTRHHTRILTLAEAATNSSYKQQSAA